MLLWLIACTGEKSKTVDPPSLSVALSDTEVRAGQVNSSDALFGGTSAEGQIGDYKLYNNKAQFIIQNVRPSAYYIAQGGGLLDADFIRPSGEQGRDIIDEHTPMAGFGRILNPTSVSVVDDGESGEAVVRVLGNATAFELLEGAVENENMIPDKTMEFQVDYSLLPNSSLLKIETTIRWQDEAFSFQPANVILLGKEVIDIWNPGGGFKGESNNQWYGAVSHQNEVSLGLFPSADTFSYSVIQPLLADATPAMSGFDEMVDFETGTVHTFTHYVGVASDLATLTDQWYGMQEVTTEAVAGTVTSGSEALAGARVRLFDSDTDTQITMAISDENGTWSAEVPTGVSVSYQVSGRGNGIFYDLPRSAGWYGMYADTDVTNGLYASLQESSPDTSFAFAEGYGVADLNTDTLPMPSTLQVSLADGGTGMVLVDRLDTDNQSSLEQYPSRPNGFQAVGYIRDGDLELQVEAGEYRVIVHRGPECEFSETLIQVTEAEVVAIPVEFSCLDLPDGVYSLDPHAHAAPSADGRIGSVQRMLTHAAHGIDFHISTEHDHIADYTSLIEALKLDTMLQTIVGAEISPTLRGHHNAYPLTPNTSEVNNGALAWWSGWTTTTDLYTQIRNMLPTEGVIQANHPLGSSGLFDLGGYNLEMGTIQKPNFWASDFDVMELINDGSYQSYLPYYFNLLSRGHFVSPVSVSDSHGHANGVGINRTYAYAPIDGSEAEVLSAMKAGEVVASVGPYIHVLMNDQFAPGRTFVGAQTVDVELYHPSWMDIDTVSLYENGEIVESIEYIEGTLSFDISPVEDAHYAIAASGTFPMTPLYNNSPWAISGAFFVDVAGDGWTSPLSALE